jgi:hypothetical protein
MRWMLVTVAIAGCAAPAQQGYYAGGPNPGGDDDEGGYASDGEPAEADPDDEGEPSNFDAEEPPQQPEQQQPHRKRHIKINGARLGKREAATLANLEAVGGVTLPDGAYWYDTVSGAFGEWGRPPAVLIGAGHALGPKLPANASRGTSGVYINGRRLQVGEVQTLSVLTNYPWQPGRYFVDAQGNVGVEGGPVIVNLFALIQAHQQTAGNSSDGTTSMSFGLGGYHRGAYFSDGKCRTYSDTKGNMIIGSGC